MGRRHVFLVQSVALGVPDPETAVLRGQGKILVRFRRKSTGRNKHRTSSVSRHCSGAASAWERATWGEGDTCSPPRSRRVGTREGLSCDWLQSEAGGGVIIIKVGFDASGGVVMIGCYS